MKLQVTAYALTGERLQVLEEARKIQFTNDGVLTFDYPKTGKWISYFDNDIALGIEIEALAGKSFGPLTYTQYGEVTSRFLYTAEAASRTDKTGLWSFTATNFGDALFPKMPILPALGNLLAYPSTATPYTVMANRVAENAARGLNYGITVVDGGGWTTPNAATNLTFSPFDTLDAYYSALNNGQDAVLHWVGTTLYVLTPSAMAIDRSVVVGFQIQDFSDVPVQYDRTGMADTILALGDNGTSSMFPAAAPGKVLAVQFSGITDPTTLALCAENEWGNRQEPARQITAALALSKNPLLVPYRDYHVGSLVSFPTVSGDTEVIAVGQITLTRDTAPDFSGNVVLDTVLKDIQLRLVELGKLGVNNVTAVSGNGGLVLGPVNVANIPLGSITSAMLAAAVTNLLPQVGDTKEGRWSADPTGFLIEDGRAVSRTTYAALFAFLNPSKGICTISNANPGVVTLAGHGLSNGAKVFLTTTGVLPTGLTANTQYFVVAATTNTFELAATRGGTAIATTSAGSGTHTLWGCEFGVGDGSTTFNIPDSRGMFSVGYKSGDANFGILGDSGGSASHSHTLTAGYAFLGFGTSFINRIVATVTSWTSTGTRASAASGSASAGSFTDAVQLGGSTDPATALPPFTVLNRAIKY